MSTNQQDFNSTDEKVKGLANEELQEAMLNPATQVMFRAGLLACREYMASFVEQGGNKDIADSIRANWWPSLGADPGRPRRLRWGEFYEGEYPDGRCKTKEEVSPSVEALVHAMGFLMQECGWPLSHPCFGEPDVDYEPPEPDGECFRGGEAAAYNAEEQARIQRELK
jgi:hypothetical protein